MKVVELLYEDEEREGKQGQLFTQNKKAKKKVMKKEEVKGKIEVKKGIITSKKEEKEEKAEKDEEALLFESLQANMTKLTGNGNFEIPISTSGFGRRNFEKTQKTKKEINTSDENKSDEKSSSIIDSDDNSDLKLVMDNEFYDA